MKHYGDITKLSGYTLPIVDVITGGSPCQDLSVAGKRAGLSGERSGLFMEQVRIVKEMRARDVQESGRAGQYVRPRYMVWENVPGAFSSNGGRDFQAVLSEIAKIAEPDAADVPMPEKGKWPNAGCVYDELGCWSIAWRVHDAQFWGVPQRRKRISLVADFGGLSAPEILFERKGLSRDPEPGEETGKATAGAAGSGADGASPVAVHLLQDPITAIDSTPCLSAGSSDHGQAMLGVMQSIGCDVYNQEITGDVAASLTADCGGTNTSGAKVLAYGFEPGAAKRLDTENRFVREKAPTLRADMGDNQTSVLCLNDQGGSVMGVSEDVTGALRAQEHGHQPAVCAGFSFGQSEKARGIGYQEEVSPTLRGGEGGNQKPCILQSACVGIDLYNQAATGVVSKSLNSAATDSDHIPCVMECFQNTGQGWWNESDVGATIRTPCGGDSVKANLVLNSASVVRRLTPLECERLQGYPDGWTDIGDWTDSKGKKHKDADSPRYKALGNSIALPFWQWMSRRICAMYERNITMASLFDGIGGFPLVFERCGAKAVWASEIEEFPIAVTKKHFPEVDAC